MLRSLHQLFFPPPAHTRPTKPTADSQAPTGPPDDTKPHTEPDSGMYNNNADTHRAPSPVYDVPELPTLRRVKPLPKRRRTSDPAPHGDDDDDNLSPGGASGRTSPDEPVEDGARPAALTAQMALQAYYMPVLGGVRDLFKTAPADADSRGSTPLDLSGALAGLGTGFGFGLGSGYGYGYADGGGGGMDGRDGLDDDESGEGDYVDHLQQPGNTKKRKVPANMSGSAHGHDGGDSASGGEDEPAERGIPTGREREAELGSLNGGGGSGGGGGGTGVVPLCGMGAPGTQGRGGRRGRLTRATLAGLQHKEMLRSRKRQLAVVLGALAHGDTLALDHALSASYPFVQTGIDFRSGAPVRVRPSQRREARLARAFQMRKESLAETDAQPRGGDENTAPAPLAAPSAAFTFVFHCATSDRLIATKEEVAILHGRFEEELARQAAKAAEAAKAAAAAAAPASKRTDRTKAGAGKGAEQTDAPAASAKSKGGKKKKRSALANASNPHHLRNYVPSRLPHTGPPSAQQAAQNAQNMLSPLPLRFLGAEIPPRRRKKADPPPPPTPAPATLTNPAEEWICPFCEHELFYGDEQSYHRAVRNRKKILRRRRRARERAAAAASGVAPPATAAALHAADKGAHEVAPTTTLDAPVAAPKELASSPGKAAKWKEGDRGGRGVTAPS